MGSTSTISIDGPVASGKTTVGRLLAQKLGYRFLDTGVMYRALTWAALEAGVSAKDSIGLVRLTREQVMEVVFRQDGKVSILVGDRDVTPYLWHHEVGQNVSLVAQIAGVRDVLVSHQRRIAQEGSVVMAGRDIGTVVLPDAPVKVFLMASVAERARRRRAELQALGYDVPYRRVLEELEQRDRLDSERRVAPLRPAPDAHVIVTDDRSAEEIVERILELVKRP